MSAKNCIFLLEDEVESGEMLENFLQLNNFDVIWAKDGLEATKLLEENATQIDIAILDIMVPHKDGKEICTYIRNHPVIGDIPILFLTAKDEEVDEIQGLNLGADDYISKPASLNIIKAHIEAHIRRKNPEKSSWVQYGPVHLDTIAKEMYIEDKQINLTLTEYTIAELFLQHPKVVYSRQQILENLGEEDKFVFDRTIDVHIKNLRIKMGKHGNLIKTYRGVGYGFNRELYHQ